MRVSDNLNYDLKKGPDGWEELIIEMVVKGTGKENAWRRKVADNRNIQIYERLLYQRGNRIKTVSKNSSPLFEGLFV